MTWQFLIPVVIAMYCSARPSQEETPHALIRRIIGGNTATPRRWPWQVSIQVYTGRWQHICGGSLISVYKVVTAAHCVDPFRKVFLRVVAGEFNLKVHEGTEQIRGVRTTIINYLYRNSPEDAFPFDVAVLMLEYKVFKNSYVRPIRMAMKDDRFLGEWCTVTGWGVTFYNNTYIPDKLQETKLKILSNKECRELWEDDTNAIQRYHVCASGEKSLACFGDSGGPLACPVQKNEYVLVGITSWGFYNCSVLPDGFSRVSFFYPWLNWFE